MMPELKPGEYVQVREAERRRKYTAGRLPADTTGEERRVILQGASQLRLLW